MAPCLVHLLSSSRFAARRLYAAVVFAPSIDNTGIQAIVDCRLSSRVSWTFFFFQAEDGIRDHCVTGVQTCALPICFNGLGLDLRGAEFQQGSYTFHFPDGNASLARLLVNRLVPDAFAGGRALTMDKIGRASCRERV